MKCNVYAWPGLMFLYCCESLDVAVRTKNGLRSNLRVSKYKNWPGEGRVGKKGAGWGLGTRLHTFLGHRNMNTDVIEIHLYIA